MKRKNTFGFKAILTLLLSYLAFSISAQTVTISGIITDDSGLEVIGATVIIEGDAAHGTVTDIDGKFILNNVPSDASLSISYVGMKTQVIPVNGRTIIDVVLSSDTELLDEIVVVGFGTQRKVNLTGSVAVVKADDIASRPVANVTQALQGLVPGMNFSYGSGGNKVGSSLNINVRGVGTLDGNIANAAPLVLIDGIEGDIDVLNPNDVESISVLKDAAASSIYGSRAPYGVILITTKKGKAGKVAINYNNSMRWSKGINMPEMADAYTYGQFINKIRANDGQGVTFTPEHLQRIKDYMDGKLAETTFPDPGTPTIWDWRGNSNVDWLDEIFGGVGFSQEHSLSVNGGSERVQYFLSANYLNQNGIVRYGDENMDRYTINGKINAQVSNWSKVNYNMRFIRRDLDLPYELDNHLFYYNTMRRWPSQALYDPNGNMQTELPKQLMHGGNNKTQTDWVTQQLQLELEPLKNWRTFLEINYKTINEARDEIRNKLPKYNIEGDIYYDAGEKSSIYSRSDRTNFFNINIYSEYTHQINKHTLKEMVGFQSELNKWRRIGARKEDLITENLPNINVATGKEYAYGNKNHWATAGFFGRLNYDYAERYLLEVNFRYDASSRFASDKRWSLFPSLSAGWNIAREDFMEPYLNTLNTLKLRGSWGELGNQNTVDLYPYIQRIPYYPSSNTNQNNWLINGARYNGATAPSLISTLLTWETMRSWNIGFDLGMFRNRLNLTFDYFVRTTLNMVGPAPELPATLGTAVPKVNNADLRSTGFELDLSWRDHINEFSYGINFLLSDDRQKVIKYPNKSGSFATWREGQYLNEIWGFTTIGIAKSQEEMDQHLASLPNGGQSSLASSWYEGDIMYKDLNNDGKISEGNTIHDTGDISLIGNGTPRFKYGLNLDAKWKEFDVRLFVQGVGKRDWAFADNHIIYWGNAGGIWNSAAFTNNLDFYRESADDFWSENKNAKFPRLTDSNKNRRIQTRYLENAAYLRLKNLQFGYTIPAEITKKASISTARLFFSAENLLTITSLPKGIDPETLGINDYGGAPTYPLSRTLSVGVNINF